MGLGFVYLVFLPSVISTPFAGRTALRWETQVTCAGALALAALGLTLLLLPLLPGYSRAWSCSVSEPSMLRRSLQASLGGRQAGPRSGERHVSAMLFRRWIGWQRRAGPSL